MDESYDAKASTASGMVSKSCEQLISSQPTSVTESTPVSVDQSKTRALPVNRDQPSQRGGRGWRNNRDRGRGGQNKRRDMGRGEWSRTKIDKRARNDAEQEAKRRKVGIDGDQASGLSKPFSHEDIATEGRKPKRKVAVLIGYSGSGYKGMQTNLTEKTIEGDLFAAFVAAGAISKANADDPKKSSLVRCARTDKGVHASGNVISLKLIVEDPNIVKKINDNLSPQIRVWGIERTNGSFSCYQTCDSRVYEYLIPTHAFLPPHPRSYLGRKIKELAEEAGDVQGFQERQKEVASFWDDVEKEHVVPILDTLDEKIRTLVMQALYDADLETEVPEMSVSAPITNLLEERSATATNTDQGASMADAKQDEPTVQGEPTPEANEEIAAMHARRQRLDAAIKSLKAAYILAKKRYRISSPRLARIRSALSLYVGTRNYHNYTVQKTYRDPSAKRVIRSFVVGETPIIIDNTEWLSLKVHGQSFMMHQIRKMVSMVALIVRCGCPVERILQSYGEDNMSIPKAPGLGLLLERPVFDTYNERAVTKLEREKIDFGKFETEMQEFKQREIYERIFREEERDNQYGYTIERAFPETTNRY
ncbi:MAG: tRNA pseudouridine synthase 1 [Pycnora praestabilis]|nr:MAG: tRNA pseudouridine synthase 1 [Pycnora praestabilis]